MHRLAYILLMLMALAAASCTKGREPVPNPLPSVYYWRTTLRLSDRENEWLQQNRIGKLYLRLFDVTVQGDGAMPQATLSIEGDLPKDVEIIPTVFIEEPVMRQESDLSALAQKLVQRVAQMGETHGFSFQELQVDCDWTARSQDLYFSFLQAIRQHQPSWRLSATIRLHQLAMTPPPVDYGALMLYNTGDFRKANADRNPILDRRDVGPYMKYLPDYDLPLCAAYPNFSWPLLFSGDDFKGILYGVDMNDSTLFHRLNDREYDVINARTIALSMGAYTIDLLPGQKVFVWHVSEEEIADIQQLVEKYRPEIHKQIITYTLDEKNI